MSSDLGCLVDEDGSYGLLAQPRRGPQAGKSGDTRSQNADSSPRAQGALGLGFEVKPKGQAWSAVGPNSLRPWSTRGG